MWNKRIINIEPEYQNYLTKIVDEMDNIDTLYLILTGYILPST